MSNIPAPHHAWDDYCKWTPCTGSFNIYEDIELEAPYGEYRFDNVKLHRIATVSLTLEGSFNFPTEDDDEMTDSEGHVSFLDPEGNEVCTIEIGGLEFPSNKWFDRLQNIFAKDIYVLCMEDALQDLEY